MKPVLNLLHRLSPARLSKVSAAFFIATMMFPSGASAQSLPAPWLTLDVGSPGNPGSASYSSPTFTVTGVGTDIYGTADEFRFVYQPINNTDCTIIARVASIEAGLTWSKAGVMIRDSVTDPGSRNVAVMVTADAGNGINFQRRTTAGGTTAQTVTAGHPAKWVRLVRSGSNFTASWSDNGTSWTTIGTTQVVTLNATVYVGLAVSSFSHTASKVATFDNVSVTGDTIPVITTTTLPGGGQSIPYSQTLAAGGGNGALVWSLLSGTLPTGVSLSSGGVISGTPTTATTYNFTVKVADSDGFTGATDEDTQALSIAVAANSVPNITTSTLPAGAVSTAYSQTLAATGGDGTLVWILDTGSLPAGLSLSSGGVISGTPTTAGTYNFTVRLADTDSFSGASDEDTQALSIVINGTLPAPWLAQAIGTATAGSSSYSGGTYTVSGSGADIYGTADGFRFSYQPITGDCTIIANVTGVQQTGTYSKGGIMIREDLTPGSKNVSVLVTPPSPGGNAINFERRTTAGGTTAQTTLAGTAAPEWVKLVRANDSFTAWHSNDGLAWSQIGTAQTVAMNQAVYVGLAVSSFVDGSLCTATFDNVTVLAGISYAQDFNTDAMGYGIVSGYWARGATSGTYNVTGEAGTSIAVYQNATLSTDYTYSAAIQSPQSGASDLIGLVYNYADSNNYYWLSLSPTGGAELKKMLGGTASSVATSSWTFPGVNTLFDVDIIRAGTATTVKINGTTIFNGITQSDAAMAVGKFGFYASSNSPKFDDVTVSGTLTPVAAYYVDFTGGLDTNNGLSPATAWKTIAKVNSSTFSPGAVVLFKCGETWHEQLTIPSSGTATQPIRFGAYGSGAKPAIDATTEINSGWTVYSGNIYVADVAFDVKQVFLNGAYLPVAHYPNAASLATVDAPGTPPANGQGFLTAAVTPPSNIVGADIRVRPENWDIDESIITSVSGSRINYTWTSGSGWVAHAGGYYVVANKLWMLDAAGEWFCDAATGKLYIWMPNGASPNGQHLKAAQCQHGVYATLKQFIIIEDLAFTGQWGDGVNLVDTTEFVVQRLDMTNIGTLRYTDVGENDGKGVRVSRTATLATQKGLISDNTITTAVHGGVAAYQLQNLTVSDNTINHVGDVGWSMFLQSRGVGIDLTYSCNNSVIRRNSINYVSWSGIRYNSGNTLIEENVIQQVMTNLTDGGAIYSFGVNTAGSVLRRNMIFNNIDTHSFAIYLDEKTESVTAEFNTVSDHRYGLMIHFGRYNIIQDNTFYGAYRNTVKLQEDGQSTNYMTGNLLQRNIYFAKVLNPPGPYPTELFTNWNTAVPVTFAFGTFTNNTFSNRDPSQTGSRSGTSFPGGTYTLAGWQGIGYESGSTYVAQIGSANPNDDSVLLRNATADAKTFPLSDYGNGTKTWLNLDGTSVTWPITLPPFTSKVLKWSGF